jgi:hypothetical protein
VAPGSSDWLRATPSTSTSATFIPDEAFQYACRYRLNLPSHDIDTADCCLCMKKQAVKNDSWHYLSCMKSLGGNKITARHHGIRNILANFATKSGAIVEIEPSHCFSDNLLRPDLEIIMGSQRYFIDVTIISPTNPSNLSYGLKLLGAAAYKEKMKQNKYAKLSNEAGASFIPFVIESYGGLGKQAKKFIETLGVYSREHGATITTQDLISGLRYTMSCMIQRGNGLIMQTGRMMTAYANNNPNDWIC